MFRARQARWCVPRRDPPCCHPRTHVTPALPPYTWLHTCPVTCHNTIPYPVPRPGRYNTTLCFLSSLSFCSILILSQASTNQRTHIIKVPGVPIKHVVTDLRRMRRSGIPGPRSAAMDLRWGQDSTMSSTRWVALHASHLTFLLLMH